MKKSPIPLTVLAVLVSGGALAQEPEPRTEAPLPTEVEEPLAAEDDAVEVEEADGEYDPSADEAPLGKVEGALEEAEAAAESKSHCKRFCQGDFAVGLGVGYTYFATGSATDDYVVVDTDTKRLVHPMNSDPGNRGSGYGITFTGHFGYTVADNWMIGAAVHYAYQFKTLQLEAFGRYYIKMAQPDTVPFIGLRLGYLWAMGSHKVTPPYLTDKIDYDVYDGDGKPVLDDAGNQKVVKADLSSNQVQANAQGEIDWVDKGNSNGYLGALELGVTHFFTPTVGVFVTLGYQYVFTGYHKGGGVDIKGGIAFGF